MIPISLCKWSKWAKYGHWEDADAIYVADWGMAATEDELLEAFDDPVQIMETGELLQLMGGLIDSGHGAKTVYDICIRIFKSHREQRPLPVPPPKVALTCR